MTVDDAAHRVVINDEEQYSIWPDHLPNAPGWHDTGFVGTRQECLSHIETVWTDIRPRSVREHLAETARIPSSGLPRLDSNQ